MNVNTGTSFVTAGKCSTSAVENKHSDSKGSGTEHTQFVKSNMLIRNQGISGPIKEVDRELDASTIVIFGSARKRE